MTGAARCCFRRTTGTVTTGTVPPGAVAIGAGERAANDASGVLGDAAARVAAAVAAGGRASAGRPVSGAAAWTCGAAVSGLLAGFSIANPPRHTTAGSSDPTIVTCTIHPNTCG